MKSSKRALLIAVLLAALILPYILAGLAAGDHQYVGFLINPFDSASYLAKMRQGWEGSWRFVLPFTAEPGDGAYLFTFYLFLGHLARWIGLSLVLVFHLARIAGALALLLALSRLVDHVFSDRPGLANVAFALAGAGAGMGWLLMFSGYMASDAWVAEAYPFLSMFSNPHFSIGLALLLWYFTVLLGDAEGGSACNDDSRRLKPRLQQRSPSILASTSVGLRGNTHIGGRCMLLALVGLAVSVIMPFGVVVGLLVAGVVTLWRWLEERAFRWQPVFWFGILGGPFLLYQFWVAQSDPVLAGWNAQNVTITRPLWDVLLSLSPALPLAIVGAAALWRLPKHPARRLLIGWLVMGLALIYLPFSLQRRFMLGLYIPIALLAVFGVDFLRQRYARPLRGLVQALLGLSLLTNLLLIMILMLGAFTRPAQLYLNPDEADALDWIHEHTQPDALVLASPEIGQWLPGLTGRRVIYGHPYETVHAEAEEAAVEQFYMGQQAELPQARGVDYIFYGPREEALGLSGGPDLSALPRVFENAGVVIFQVRP